MHPNPDPGFMRKLKGMDKRLGCKFNPDIERFVITFERPMSNPVSLFVIKGGGEGLGYFRQPDDRDLVLLHKYDLSRTTMNDYLLEISKYMEDVRERDRKNSRENFRNMTKDDKIQLMNVMARPYNPKAGTGTFRRIKPKSSKNTVRVIDRRMVH